MRDNVHRLSVALLTLLLIPFLALPGCRDKGAKGGRASPGEEKKMCADDIWSGGKVYTVDGSFSVRQAFAVRDGRFLFVGNGDEALAHRCASTRVHDLEGKVVLPGLVDSHAHLLSLGLMDTMLELGGLSAAQEAASLVSDRTNGLEKGRWILGRGWDQTLWEGKAFPDRDLLDRAAPDNPVLLKRVDGHAAWVNTRALEIASITRDTPDPPGGKILRRNDGQPLGVLVDNAIDLVSRHVDEPTRQERKKALRRAVDLCLSTGLTMVHDAGIDGETLEAYRELIEEGDFPFRVYAMISWDSGDRASLINRGPLVAWKDRLWLRAVKLYADGALGSRGAALLEEYADDPGNTGLLVMDEDDLREAIGYVVEKGFQPAVHAIGDRANRSMLDIYADVLETHAGKDLRPRIEHAQVIAPGDIPRFGKLGVVAAMQPTHCTSDMRWAQDRLGPGRVGGAYAWRKVLESGALIASGSDFPVESHNPFFGLHAAVTRQDRKSGPEGGWHPGERMTLDEAVRSFTIAGALASFNEKILGSIEAGKLADFIVLEDDIFSMPPGKIHEARVALTVVGGDVVYRASR